MLTPEFRYKNRKDRAIMFFTGSSINDAEALLRSGIYDILYSYHYIRKAPAFFEKELMPEIQRNGGYFMTDSGAFSFINNAMIADPYYHTERAWLTYLNEYVEWLHLHKSSIYVAANLDIDKMVGREIVDKWNLKYFKPLQQSMQISFVAHEDKDYNDPFGVNRVTQYLQEFPYIGVNQKLKQHAGKIYTLVQSYKARCHGFAWTSIPLLKKYPFFSVDSTTWLGGSKYGTTYKYDGKNFRTINYEKKYVRKNKFVDIESTGLFNREEIREESRNAVNFLNLEGWKGARIEYLKSANSRLKNRIVPVYAQTRL